MYDKQDGRCFVRHIAFDMFTMRSGSKWPMIGPRPCAYVDPVFTSQSYDISISTVKHKHKHKKNELVHFSCAYAFAYAYVNVDQLGRSFGLFPFCILQK